MKNKVYWTDKALHFNKYYSNSGTFSIKAFVSKFLYCRTNAIMSLISPVCSKAMLDVGCGSGIHIKMALSRFKRVVGMDISGEMLINARKRLSGVERDKYELLLWDAEKNFPFKSNKFDVVISIGLLDYVNPKTVLLECKRVLNKDGFIIFTLPKRPSIFFFLRGYLGNLIRKNLLDLPHIENIANKKGLYSLIKECGFEPLCIKSVWTTMWVVKAKNSEDKLGPNLPSTKA